jgi:hypothetical protein
VLDGAGRCGRRPRYERRASSQLRVSFSQEDVPLAAPLDAPLDAPLAAPLADPLVAPRLAEHREGSSV